MPDFKDYNGVSIEAGLQATTTSDGLISFQDKSKLDTVATNANNYTHPATHPATIITEDASHRFISDAERTSWNAKASTTIATQTTNGLMSSGDKTKLDGIATGANNYSHPGTHPATMITEDTSHKFVTDTQINTWNGKAGTAVATTTANGLMSSGDKTKLNGIATGANNYSHPATHPPSIIVQDASNRFVSDTEKNAWNNKAGTTVATTGTNGLMSAADKTKLTNLGNLVVGADAKNVANVAPNTTVTVATVTLPPGVHILTGSFQFNISSADTLYVGVIYDPTGSTSIVTGRGVMTGGGGITLSTIVNVTASRQYRLDVVHLHSAAVTVQNIMFKAVRVK